MEIPSYPLLVMTSNLLPKVSLVLASKPVTHIPCFS